MTHVYSQQIDDIIKSNKVHRFVAELEEATDPARKKQIKKLLHREQSILNPQKLKEEKMKNHIRVLRESQYKKRWQDLKMSQKQDRVDEFVKRNDIDDEELVKRLKQYIEDGYVKTRNITYDIAKGHITSIDVLTNDSGSYVLESMTPKKKKRSKSKSKNSDSAKDSNAESSVPDSEKQSKKKGKGKKNAVKNNKDNDKKKSSKSKKTVAKEKKPKKNAVKSKSKQGSEQKTKKVVRRKKKGSE